MTLTQQGRELFEHYKLSRGSDGAQCSLVRECERVFDAARDYAFHSPINVIELVEPIMRAFQLRDYDRPWQLMVSKNGIKPDFRSYNKAVSCSREFGTSPPVLSKFLQCIEVKPQEWHHDFLMKRAASKTLSYGSMPLLDWFAFFCAILDRNTTELRLLAGYIMKTTNAPFHVHRQDSSDLREIELFYNIHNIFESLLNICEIHLGMCEEHIISINGESFDLWDYLSELAMEMSHNSKVFVKNIRHFLTFVIRFAGLYSDIIVTYVHHGFKPNCGIKSSHLAPIRVDPIIAHAFINAPTYVKVREDGFQKLIHSQLPKLSNFLRKLLTCSLLITTRDYFTKSLRFLQSVMKIAGYGRALKQAIKPNISEERSDDPLDLVHESKNIILNFHEQVVKNGYIVVTPDDWIAAYVSSWHSTSAGVAAEKVSLLIDGKPEIVKVKNKMSLGSLTADKCFSKSLLSQKHDRQNPCSFGYRNVPYKVTRIIYGLPLPIMNCQIAVSSHLMQYIAEEGTSKGRAGKMLDPSFVFTGTTSTTGVRVDDNYNIIASSGSSDLLALDIDFSAYDQHSVYWNYRLPLMATLKEIGSSLPDYKYGPDGISWDELVEYGYGSGHVHDTYWDNTRDSVIYIMEDYYNKINAEFRTLFEEYTVGPDIKGLSSYNAPKKISSGRTIYKLDTKYMESDDGNDVDLLTFQHFMENYRSALRVGAIFNGYDLVHVTCEASGELTTLFMNSVQNLAMQTIILRELRKTSLGSSIEALNVSVVGDDVEIITRLVNVDMTSDDVELLLHTLKITFEMMGHEISLPKTFVSPFSTEYVQTFGRFGLYIYKDQIMLIPSEKPRNIRDHKEYLISRKRLLCSKMARGYDDFFSLLVLLYEVYVITGFSVKGAKVVIGEAESKVAKFSTARIGAHSSFQAICIVRKIEIGKYVGASALRSKRKRGDHYIFYHSDFRY